MNIRNSFGCTALHRAAGRGHEGVVKLLLEKGADINIQDNNGGTSLDVAREEAYWNIVKLLEEKGCCQVSQIQCKKRPHEENVQSLQEKVTAAENDFKRLKLELKLKQNEEKIKELEGSFTEYGKINESLKKLGKEKVQLEAKLADITHKIEQVQEHMSNLESAANTIREKSGDYDKLKSERKFLQAALTEKYYDVIETER